MPKHKIHLVEQVPLVVILSCTKCGLEHAGIVKHWGTGNCKRCGGQLRTIYSRCSPYRKFKHAESIHLIKKRW